jgi:hypothetical protein
MKPAFLKCGLSWLVVLPGLLLCQNLRAAVGFSLAPPAVSNTYLGAITLQITGLTNCETVVVQRFLDVNANGLVDGADFLWQQFALTDGQASVIGGVTNINVPGDTDPTPGSIAARVRFPSTDPGLNFIGRYLWTLSSPTGLFAPMTTPLTVTNIPYAQGLTGHVRNNGTNVPNAFVLAFFTEDDGPGWVVASAVADNSGAYTIKLPAGTYLAAAFKSNYLGNLAPSPVTVDGGAMVTADLALSNTSRTISGRLVDAANPAVGLPGLLVHAITGGLVAGGNSDSNGFFTLQVVPGRWRFGGSSVEALGYVDRDSDYVVIDTSTGSVSGLVLCYPKATGLFYGSVKDVQGEPLAGVWVHSASDNDLYDFDAFTDPNGNYVAGALEGDSWKVEIESDEPEDQPVVTGYLFSESLRTNLLAGQTALHDFTAIRTTQFIAGHLWDSTGGAISNVEIHAYAGVGGKWYHAEDDTDINGGFLLNVANGTWNVDVSTGGYPGSLSSLYWPPPSQEVVISNNNATVNFTSSIAPYRIIGSVRDEANNPFPDLFVYAAAMIDGTYRFQFGMTDVSGNYALGVVTGNWDVGVDCDELRERGYGCAENQQVSIANGNATVNFIAQQCELQITTPSPLSDGEVNAYYDVQFQASGCGGGFNWSATNLPAGLHLSEFGELSGYPEICGSNYFVVQVSDDYGASSKTFGFVIHPPTTGSITDYLVGKARSHHQSSALGPVPDAAQGPYNAYLWIQQEPYGAVSEASCTLPNGMDKVFPSGCSSRLLQVHDAFASQAACDAAYPAGSYVFHISTPNDGEQTSILNLPAVAFLDAPRICNYPAAQFINPATGFVLQWDAIAGGTEEDFIRLIILGANDPPDFKVFYPEAVFEDGLPGDATSSFIPADRLEPDRTYVGLLQFIRTTSINDMGHPNAVGQTFVSAQTVFNLATRDVGLLLSEPERVSPTQFRFVLTGLPGQCYTILKSTNLSSANWSVLLVTNAPAESFTVLDPWATNRSAFYRAVTGP